MILDPIQKRDQRIHVGPVGEGTHTSPDGELVKLLSAPLGATDQRSFLYLAA
jgi:hypothetical protein